MEDKSRTFSKTQSIGNTDLQREIIIDCSLLLQRARAIHGAAQGPFRIRFWEARISRIKEEAELTEDRKELENLVQAAKDLMLEMEEFAKKLS